MLDFTVSEMEAAPADFDCNVDIKWFCDYMTCEIICSGLLTSGCHFTQSRQYRAHIYNLL